MQNQNMASMMMNAAGGPVGGTSAMHNNRMPPETDSRTQLNTYIYDYFLKNNHITLAKAMLDNEMKMKVTQKPSPSGRNDMNGLDVDPNSKENLPAPGIPEHQTAENSFLLDWWQQFWDIFSAARSKGPSTNTKPITSQYLATTRALAGPLRNLNGEQNARVMMLANGMNSQAQAPYRSMMQGQLQNGGMNPNDVKRVVMNNNRNPNNPTQMANMIQMNKQGLMAANMQRDGSGMDMNGQRTQSPNSTDNAPSPPKRPRIEGGQFNGQGMGAARTQGMPQQTMAATSAGQPNQQMMLAAGGNFNEFAQQASNVQQKSIEVYAQSLAHQQRTALNNQVMVKGTNPGVQGSPMNQQSLEGQHDLYTGNPARMTNGAPGPAQGNHALQDYQMQLMLLEQQNKKRLLMARQEQDNMSQGPHGQAGGPGFPPTMSPQGSRSGPSPNPNDQIKRGTPKLNQQGLPGSPLPDVSMPQNRNSPVPNFGDHGQIGPGAMPPQFYQMQGGQAGPMMRPPSSHPGGNAGNFNGQLTPQHMEAMRNGNMQNAQWRGPQQMMQNQMQPGPMNTVQQRNPMPPPPAPPAGEQQPGRTQEPSPSQPAAAPPTPNQGNKSNSRKKDTKDNKKKTVKKNAATTGATPASEAEPPPTPTPSTPITPMNQASFNKTNGQGPQHGQQHQQQPPAQPPAAAPAPQVQPPQMDGAGPFGNLGDEGVFPGLDLEGIMDSGTTFNDFDFDSFLTTDDGGGFGGDVGGFNFGPDGVEAGTGDI